jgi:hypothetical protein
MVADLIAPQGDEWYRRLDNVVFADDYFDATALINRANYVFASRRRLYELGVDKSKDEAILQATAEGWLVPSPERALI